MGVAGGLLISTLEGKYLPGPDVADGPNPASRSASLVRHSISASRKLSRQTSDFDPRRPADI